MGMDASVNGITPSQARLLVEMLAAQSQQAAANTLLGSTSDGTDGTGQSSDFAGLLSSALNDGSFGTGTASMPGWAGNLPQIGGSPLGNQIGSAATQLAADLRGPFNRAYDPTQTPLAAQQALNTPGWGNGNVQCVAFVDGAYRQAGIQLPAHPNGGDFWGAYANQPGWQEIPNGQGLPQPGDILAFSGGAQGFGHVAVVTGVIPPANGQPGSVTFAQSNSPTTIASLAITSTGAIQAWPGYQVQGSIRYGQ